MLPPPSASCEFIPLYLAVVRLMVGVQLKQRGLNATKKAIELNPGSGSFNLVHSFIENQVERYGIVAHFVCLPKLEHEQRVNIS